MWQQQRRKDKYENRGAEATDGSIKRSRAKGIKEAAARLLPADRTLKLIGKDKRTRKKSVRPFLANGWILHVDKFQVWLSFGIISCGKWGRPERASDLHNTFSRPIAIHCIIGMTPLLGHLCPSQSIGRSG
jgi:hypothetical protein